ncbi:MAG: phosphoglycerate mutase family protein [Patescibacteria group bacterium]|nr:phosphoglycerate mutase family protein [Patescibacteria group bacterium]
MRYLIIMRHGEETENDFLGFAGRLKVTAVAKRITAIVKGPVVVISSPWEGACETAEILAKKFKAELRISDILFASSGKDEDCFAAAALVLAEKEGTEAVILVTHLKYAKSFPSYYGKHFLGGVRWESKELDKGEAWLIDCDAKILQKITD